eukprot:3232121-Amphidinium_carterae.1
MRLIARGARAFVLASPCMPPWRLQTTKLLGTKRPGRCGSGFANILASHKRRRRATRTTRADDNTSTSRPKPADAMALI